MTPTAIRNRASRPTGEVFIERLETPRGHLSVVRDDLYPGGTKARVLPAVLEVMPYQEFVFSSPAYGYAQLALALSCRIIGRKATIFTAKRSEPHPLTAQAMAAGAEVHFVAYGRLNVVRSRARRYAEEHGAFLFPMGFAIPAFEAALTAHARSLAISPAEVWSVAGSGALSRSLQAAWPAARFFAIQIGWDLTAKDVGRARLLVAPESFEEPALRPPPFPSCPQYDAKAWRFMMARASDGALFWNTA